MGVLVVVLGFLGFAASSTDLQGALRNTPRFRLTDSPTPITAQNLGNLPQSTNNAGNSATQQSQSTGPEVNCISDELQTITIQADRSTTYQQRYLEKAFNEYFDSNTAGGYAAVLKKAILQTLPLVREITSFRIESDHFNYQENGEHGTITIDHLYEPLGTQNYIKQKTTTTAIDEGLFFAGNFELQDGTKFYMRSQLNDPLIKLEIKSPIQGSGYTFGSGTLPGLGYGIAQGAAYAGNFSSLDGALGHIEVLKISGTYGHENATVKRIMPDGNSIPDPILQTTVRNVLRNNPINLTGDATQIIRSDYFSSFGSPQDLNNFQESRGFAARLANLGSWYAAKQTITDGVPTNYLPVAAIVQDGKVKNYTCATDFNPSSLTVPYARGGVQYNMQ